MSGVLDVRGVNGDGPRCGCGNKSTLHVVKGATGGPQDYFLCRSCSLSAVSEFIDRRGQGHYGPEARHYPSEGDPYPPAPSSPVDEAPEVES